MKKFYSQIGVLFITALLLNSCKTNLVRLKRIDALEPTTESPKYDLKTRMDLAMEQEVQKTMDPELGYVPRERLATAVEYTKQLQAGQEKLRKAAIPGITWQEMGPSNVGGRTRALMFDPNDPTYKRVFAAGVAGGLWVTDNIYASEPSWTSVNEFFGNMAITCLAHDPLRPDTMYFGTGEGYFNADAVRGDGIYKSVDGGVNWTKMTQSGVDTFNYIQKIIVRSNGDVLASTKDRGVIKSVNAGLTWTKVLGSGLTASTNNANDLEIDASGNIYATMGLIYSGVDGIYKSTNGGSSWSKVSSGTGFPSSGFERIEIACAPSDANVVYAILQNSSNQQCLGIYRSFNAGSTWSVGTMPKSWVDSSNVAGSQAWYALTIVVDPKNPGTLITGGLDLYKSTNYGSGWAEISHWTGGAGLPNVHADQQVSLYKPNSSDTILFGNDGGVYLATGMSGTPTFYEKESNYNTTQFYACALHPDKGRNYALAGAQDNGSHKFTKGGINQTSEVTGGDGAFVHIDQNDPKYQFTSYVFNQYRRSIDSGVTFTYHDFDATSTNGKFINPTDYDNNTGNLYCAWSSGNYAVWINAKSASSLTQKTGSFTGQVSAVTVDENTTDRVWFGTDSRRVYYVDNAASSPSITNTTSSFPSGWPSSGTVSSIAIERGKSSHILVTFSNYGVNSVWESTNTGGTWTNVENNLPDMPIRWAMFSPLGGDSALLATELGVWSTTDLNGASTNWQPTNTGLANIRTDMLQYRSSDSTVIVATHGRGLYQTKYFSKIVAPRIAVSDSIVHVGEYVHFYDDSYGATSFAWDMDDDGITDTTGTSVSWAWATGGYKTVTLKINGNATTTLVIHVLPRLGTPYNVSDGGNFESNFWHFGGKSISGGVNLWELGVPGNYLNSAYSGTRVWKTDLDADLQESQYMCGLYTPSFNMTNSGTYTISFRMGMETHFCNAPFAVQVQYSVDKGENWSRLGNYGSGTNWYNLGVGGCSGSCVCVNSSIFADRIGWIYSGSYYLASYDISSLASNSDVRFRVVLSVASGFSSIGYQRDGFVIDDFTISGPTNSAAPTGVETALCSRTIALPANDSAYFYSPNGKIMGVVRNLSAHDFGNTTMTIDQAGTTPVDFDTVTAVERRRLAKTVKITPTTNNTGAKVEIQMFYDKTTEIDAWKTVTSNSAKNIQLFKSPNGIGSATIANSVYGDSTVIDSVYGANGVRIVARFNNGFSGVGSGGGGGGTPGPLPVTWVSINGKRLTDKVELTFQTGSEINNSHFDIERRVFNATEEFSAVGNVKGKGNYNGLSTYVFEDKDPKALENTPLFYRVKQVDFDGKFDYSDVVFIAPSNLSNKNIIVYPLPVKETLNIDVNIDHIGLIANVYDMQGRLIATHQLKNKSTKISTNELIAGQYLLIVTDGRQVFYNDKIIKN